MHVETLAGLGAVGAGMHITGSVLIVVGQLVRGGDDPVAVHAAAATAAAARSHTPTPMRCPCT